MNTINYKSSIKKNLIDLLMFSLYADARTIYREYIQNALDSIRCAVKHKILDQEKDGVVNIDIDTNTKSIAIRDNGTGISADCAVSRLLDISASTKDGITAAGQFGIGRLVGGGYCHKLIFKTSAKGESVATIVTFDVDRIWKMVKEDSEDYLATDVMDFCTTKEVVEEEESLHYFEVYLCNIKTTLAPVLLNEKEIISYLDEVAPVGYTSEFKNGVIFHSLQTSPEYKKYFDNQEKVQIFVGTHRIEKRYGLSIKGTKDEISQLEFFKISSSDFGLLAWGWFALTKYSIQIPKEDQLACIRLRKHNIQIGDFSLLSGKPLWKEERGNSYFYGELFIVHDNILPNAARDGLAPTPEKEVLYEGLEAYFKELTSIYTKANTAKKSIEKINEGIKKIEHTNNINDRIAIDLIDNKGIGVFNKLLKNAKFPALLHMLNLYRPDFEQACKNYEQIKATFIDAGINDSENNQDVFVNNTNPVKKSKDYLIDQEQEISSLTEDSRSQQIRGESPRPHLNLDSLEETEKQPNTSQQNIHSEALQPQSNYSLMKGDELLNELQGYADDAELWTLRKVFHVLNTYCPNNPHDYKLITTLEREIVLLFKNEK